MQDFKKLIAWQRAHHLGLLIYRETECFPPRERFGLTQQIRRAAVSNSANIAEGAGRGDREFSRYLQIALGSALELESHWLFAKGLGYPTDSGFA